MRALPGMRVLCPSDPVEAQAAVGEALRFPGPIYVRLGKNGERVLHSTAGTVALERPLLRRDGDDVVLLATGSIAHACLSASDLLLERGVSAAVYSCPTIKPMSSEWLQSMCPDLPLVTVEENTRDGEFGSAVLEALNDLSLPRPVRRMGLTAVGLSARGSAERLRATRGLDASFIAPTALDSVMASRP